jgi:hypothetical protein
MYSCTSDKSLLDLSSSIWAKTEKIGVNAMEAINPAKQPTARYPARFENVSFIVHLSVLLGI